MDGGAWWATVHGVAMSRTWLIDFTFIVFVLSGVISPLISSSILGTYQPWEFIFQCPIFLPFHTVQGYSRQEYWSGLPFLSPVDHIFSELSTMTCPSWVALQGMAHSFIELDKAVVHVISFVSFLWLWFSFCWPSDGYVASLVAQRLKHLPAMKKTWVRSLGQEDPLEKEMATHSSILAWRIPWMEEPVGLQSMGSKRVRHDWTTNTFTFTRELIKRFSEFWIYFSVLWNIGQILANNYS